MSIHYLLDGYNIIHQMPVSKLDKLEDQRHKLLQFIEEQSPQGSMNNQITVVFDSSDDVYGKVVSSTVKVIFAQNGSADDKIRALVARAGNAKNITVVTDDRDIQYAVGALGAKVVGVKKFLSRSKDPKKKLKRNKKVSIVEGKYISNVDGSKITSELKKIWLKPKNG